LRVCNAPCSNAPLTFHASSCSRSGVCLMQDLLAITWSGGGTCVDDVAAATHIVVAPGAAGKMCIPLCSAFDFARSADVLRFAFAVQSTS
jgi:hypothetical protein